MYSLDEVLRVYKPRDPEQWLANMLSLTKLPNIKIVLSERNVQGNRRIVFIVGNTGFLFGNYYGYQEPLASLIAGALLIMLRIGNCSGNRATISPNQKEFFSSEFMPPHIRLPIEVWNLVLTEFNKILDGVQLPLLRGQEMLVLNDYDIEEYYKLNALYQNPAIMAAKSLLAPNFELSSAFLGFNPWQQAHFSIPPQQTLSSSSSSSMQQTKKVMDKKDIAKPTETEAELLLFLHENELGYKFNSFDFWELFEQFQDYREIINMFEVKKFNDIKTAELTIIPDYKYAGPITPQRSKEIQKAIQKVQTIFKGLASKDKQEIIRLLEVKQANISYQFIKLKEEMLDPKTLNMFEIKDSIFSIKRTYTKNKVATGILDRFNELPINLQNEIKLLIAKPAPEESKKPKLS